MKINGLDNIRQLKSEADDFVKLREILLHLSESQSDLANSMSEMVRMFAALDKRVKKLEEK